MCAAEAERRLRRHFNETSPFRAEGIVIGAARNLGRYDSSPGHLEVRLWRVSTFLQGNAAPLFKGELVETGPATSVLKGSTWGGGTSTLMFIVSMMAAMTLLGWLASWLGLQRAGISGTLIVAPVFALIFGTWWRIAQAARARLLREIALALDLRPD